MLRKNEFVYHEPEKKGKPMKKVFTSLLGLLLALTLMVSAPAAGFAVEEPQSSLLVDIKTNRNSYMTLGIATFEVTVTNKTEQAVERVSAELLGGQLAPLGSKSIITAESACLLPGESISFTFKATLNKEAVALSPMQRLGLDFLRLWYKNIPVADNGFDDGRVYADNAKTLKFGNNPVSAVIRVWYNDTGTVVPGDIAEIVAFYNERANAMKTCQNRVTVTKSDGTTSTINSITGGSVVQNLANDMLPNDYSEKPALTFINGVSGNKTLAAYLPRSYSSLMSELNPTGVNGVKAATIAPYDDGYAVTIDMKDEVTSGPTALSDKPTYISKCMDTLNITRNDLEPFTIVDATATYTGCKIEAVFDAQGRMTKLDVTTPVRILGNLKYSVIGLNADVTGTYNGNYTFAY